jgi:predicted heme/steroid binding protein
MANTYTLIASSTVGSGGVATVTFSGIPSTYTDLVLKTSARDNRAGVLDSEMYVTFNGGSSNLSARYLYGSGTTIGTSTAGSSVPLTIVSAAATANTFSNGEIYIPNYTSANNKSMSIDSVDESNTASGVYAFLIAGLWSDSAAITSLTLTPFGANSFVQYSTFHLYGIKKN